MVQVSSSLRLVAAQIRRRLPPMSKAHKEKPPMRGLCSFSPLEAPARLALG